MNKRLYIPNVVYTYINYDMGAGMLDKVRVCADHEELKYIGLDGIITDIDNTDGTVSILTSDGRLLDFSIEELVLLERGNCNCGGEYEFNLYQDAYQCLDCNHVENV